MKIALKEGKTIKPVIMELDEKEALALWVMCGKGVATHINSTIGKFVVNTHLAFEELFGSSKENGDFLKMADLIIQPMKVKKDGE